LSKGHPGSQLEPGLAPWAKAGIILEPDTNPGTRYTAVMVTGSHGARMQYNYTHDSLGLAGAVGPSSPRWLRQTRASDVITGYDSTGGAHWTEISTACLTDLPNAVQIGLFVTSPVYFASRASIEGTPSVAKACPIIWSSAGFASIGGCVRRVFAPFGCVAVCCWSVGRVLQAAACQ
jgi:hypothetical protein